METEMECGFYGFEILNKNNKKNKQQNLTITNHMKHF